MPLQGGADVLGLPRIRAGRFCRVIAVATAVVPLLMGVRASAQRPTPMPPDSTEIEVLPVQGNIHMIVTGGSNITVQVGDVGAVLVDTGTALVSDKIIAAVEALTPLPIRFVINTNVDLDHIGGNENIFKVGEPLPGTRRALGMDIVGHQNGLNRLAGGLLGDVPSTLWPYNTFFGVKKALHVNGEAIELLHQPAAHTDGDIFVHFRRSDVLSVGDVFNTHSYPRFDSRHGGSLQGVIDALNRIIDITVPEFNQQGGTLVIPGHGRIASESDVVEYRDLVTIVRDRVETMIDENMTLDQIKAANPSLEYDGLYGADTGPYTTAMFIEAVYNDLRSAGEQ